MLGLLFGPFLLLGVQKMLNLAELKKDNSPGIC